MRYIAIILCMPISILAVTVQRKTVVYIDEMTVHTSTFLHRQDYSFGQLASELWLVNDQKVEKEDYQTQLDQAHHQELEEQAAREAAEREAHAAFLLQEQRAIIEKLVRCTIKKVEALRSKLLDDRLTPYLTFTPKGIQDQQDLSYLDNDLLPEIRKSLLESQTQTADTLQNLYDKLEPYQEKLQILYQETIRQARSQATDTKLLKDLLELVS